MTRAAGYVRTPSVERSHPELASAAQRARLERDVAQRGWQLTDVFEDSGPAARPKELPALEAAIAAAHGFDRLVIVRLDRIGMSARRAADVLTRLRAAGCELVCLEEDFDTGAESGRVVPALLERFAPAASGQTVARAGWTPQLVSRQGVHPATVVDVGAGAGTPALYRAFPDAYHVLIEPLQEFEPDLRRLVEEWRGEYVPAAVGAERGEATLNVGGDLYMSSILSVGEADAARTPRRVPITTLDALLEERNWAPPYCLKIDVEGYEHAVIEGAQRLLRDTELVIAEVSVSDRFEGGVSAAGLIELMSARGFEAVDVIDAARSSLGAHADLVFKPRALKGT